MRPESSLSDCSTASLWAGPPKNALPALIEWCASCWGINNDLKKIEATGDFLVFYPSGEAAIFTIEKIRTINQQAFLSPHTQSHKIIILMYADRMQLYGANALLKTLEEPPVTTKFFLLTDHPNLLLPTLRSRCRFHQFLVENKKLIPEFWQEIFLPIFLKKGVLTQKILEQLSLEVTEKKVAKKAKKTKERSASSTVENGLEHDFQEEIHLVQEMIEKVVLKEQLMSYLLKLFISHTPLPQPQALDYFSQQESLFFLAVDRGVSVNRSLESFFMKLLQQI